MPPDAEPDLAARLRDEMLATEQLIRQVIDLEEMASTIQDELDVARHQADAATVERDRAIKALEDSAVSTQRALEDKHRETRALAAEIEALKAVISSVYGSTSWRITAPLRMATRLVTRR